MTIGLPLGALNIRRAAIRRILRGTAKDLLIREPAIRDRALTPQNAQDILPQPRAHALVHFSGIVPRRKTKGSIASFCRRRGRMGVSTYV